MSPLIVYVTFHKKNENDKFTYCQEETLASFSRIFNWERLPFARFKAIHFTPIQKKVPLIMNNFAFFSVQSIDANKEVTDPAYHFWN